MKQDIDLLKHILVYVEENQMLNEPVQGKCIFDALIAESLLTDTTEDYIKLANHIELLVDDNLIKANTNLIRAKIPLFMVIRITAEGHRFLDNVRNDTFYKRVKKHISDNGIPLSIAAINAAAKILLPH
ncbi:DUF2513 domain-containing protein [Acidithiobacillus ferrianus]|uniref:DUF2513 domain-containing protein n=2 Tax=Acidithiobacillus ferrianus TaxID=2678518 RepID=A0A845UAL4_9PROT|nr:DUF2513 domain-containing protein [Acidithiobacillus ferrianus]NDU42807.1 DUF2513 domain-containing protein [Acidithiobacillus ferrianus]